MPRKSQKRLAVDANLSTLSSDDRRSKRVNRSGARAVPNDDEQVRYRTAIDLVEVVGYAFSREHSPPGSMDMRYWPTATDEVEDRVPMPTSADQALYQGWVKAMAKRIHEAVDEVKSSSPLRVNCEMGQARSPTCILAWLRIYHGLKKEHLQWALNSLQSRNEAAGHRQSMRGSLERFQSLLESL
jgi:hypothetical protein